MQQSKSTSHLTYDDIRLDTVRQVAKLMAAAAVTAPKSGGQLFMRGAPLFIETVIVDDKETLKALAAWLRSRGKDRQEAIWFRDAEVAEKLDCVLFVGLKDWYPPVYDCGACGYATCAEFMEATKYLRDQSEAYEFKGPQCNLRDIDLGIAVGSAAKTASLNNVDCRTQTRIAVAARKLGIIQSDVSVALSLSITHKNPGFDNTMPQVDFASPEIQALPPSHVLPVAASGGVRSGGRRRQQPVTPPRRRQRSSPQP
ncbi:MAG: hypothetical protein HY680_09565 [Chloroflexi bacterium]|nr:hypothetical protein [Chloroflexota bacterium]